MQSGIPGLDTRLHVIHMGVPPGVWQEASKAPPCTKHVTAELGCVTPYIIVPGKWTRKDMEYYANEIVAGLVNNAGHNCTKVEAMVTDGAWPQREEFINILRQVSLSAAFHSGPALASNAYDDMWLEPGASTAMY